MRTTLPTNSQHRSPSVTQPAAGSVAIGQIDLLDSSGEVVRIWRVVRSKCVIGSSPDNFVQLDEDGILEKHVTLVFGKRHTLLRALGPTQILNRNVREWLIDQATEVRLGTSRLVIHPFKPASETVIQVERLIDRAARLCKDPGGDGISVGNRNSLNAQADSLLADQEKVVLKEENLKRLENIESLLATLQESFERFRETVTSESKQSTEAVSRSLTTEFESFEKNLFTSLNQQISEQTHVQQSFVSNLSEQVVGRLSDIDLQLASVKETSLRSSEDLLQRAAAYQEWIANRLNEVVGQRAELIDAIHSLRTEIQEAALQASVVMEPQGYPSAEEQVYHQSVPADADMRIADSLERAQQQLQTYNYELQHLASERQSTEQQIAYLARDMQAVDAIDAIETNVPERGNWEQNQPGSNHAALPQDTYPAYTYPAYAYPEEEYPEEEYQPDAYVEESHAGEGFDSTEYSDAGFGNEEGAEGIYTQGDPTSVEPTFQARVSNDWVANDWVASDSMSADSTEDGTGEQYQSRYSGSLSAWTTESQEDYRSELIKDSSCDIPSEVHSELSRSLESSKAEQFSAPKLPAWFTNSESSEVHRDEPEQEQDESEVASRRLQQMLRQVTDNFREPNMELDRVEDSSIESRTDYRSNAGVAVDSNQERLEEVGFCGLDSGRYSENFEEESISDSHSAAPIELPLAPLSRQFEAMSRGTQSDNGGEQSQRSDNSGEQSQRSERFARNTPAQNSEEKQGENEESIEAYMQRLLNRVRTGSDADSSAPVNAPKGQSAPKNSDTPSREAPQSIPVEQKPELAVKREPLTSASFVPRMQAPEGREDLNALRELANSNARRAINRSDTRRGNTAFYFKLVVTGVAAASAATLFMLNGFQINIPFAGMIAAVIVTFLWGYDSMRHFKKMKVDNSPTNQGPFAPSSSAPSMVEPRQSQENRWRPTPV